MKQKLTLNHLLKTTYLLVVVLGLGNLIATNVLATSGRQMESLSQQTVQLDKDNLYLRNQIAQITSISRLEEQAVTLGYQPISRTLAVTTPAPVAYVTQ